MSLLRWSNGLISLDRWTWPCVCGRSGVSLEKREGDGATPAGRFALRQVFYRPDRVPPPRTALPRRPLLPEEGWCDDPEHADYNRLVRLPHPASCEQLWRDDHLYDLFVVLGHNDSPPRPGLGSAIFLHIAAEDGRPTAGCLAMKAPDLRDLLARIELPARIDILSA